MTALEKYKASATRIFWAVAIITAVPSLMYLAVAKVGEESRKNEAQRQGAIKKDLTVLLQATFSSRSHIGEIDLIEAVSPNDTNTLITIVRTSDNVSVVRTPFSYSTATASTNSVSTNKAAAVKPQP